MSDFPRIILDLRTFPLGVPLSLEFTETLIVAIFRALRVNYVEDF